jgi:hypothetical protein
VKWPAALLLALLVTTGRAATAYVSDELVLGMYAEANGQGQRLTTLHSGATLETLGSSGDFTQVRLSDGLTGWVKTAYLTTHEPATVRLKHLEGELDRTRAITPELAEAAARSELARLKGELMAKQAVGTGAHAPRLWLSTLAALLALACGFCLGYATLARRIRHKFGGIKVY